MAKLQAQLYATVCSAFRVCLIGGYLTENWGVSNGHRSTIQSARALMEVGFGERISLQSTRESVSWVRSGRKRFCFYKCDIMALVAIIVVISHPFMR